MLCYVFARPRAITQYDMVSGVKFKEFGSKVPGYA